MWETGGCVERRCECRHAVALTTRCLVSAASVPIVAQRPLLGAMFSGEHPRVLLARADEIVFGRQIPLFAVPGRVVLR